MNRLDGKFSGTITKNSDGSVVTDDQWIVFLAKDNAVPGTLAYYESECIRIGADDAQLESVRALRRRVDEWRKAHPELCKVPDVVPGQIILTT